MSALVVTSSSQRLASERLATCIVHRRGHVEIDSFPMRSPKADEVLVRTVVTAVSSGTELRELLGSDDEGFIPGYVHVGHVIDRGADIQMPLGTLVVTVKRIPAGKVRHRWGAHASHVIAQADALIPVPEGIPPRTAALARLAAIPMHGYRLAAPRSDDHIAVIGLGPIGLPSALFALQDRMSVVGFDRSESRVQHARSLGIEAHQTASKVGDTMRRVRPEGFTVVVDATGAPSVISDAIIALREPAWGVESAVQSRYIIQGSYAGPFCIDYHEAFRREACILLPRDMTPTDLAEVFRRVQDGLRLESIPTAVMDPRDPARVYESLRDTSASTHTILLDWSEPS